MEPSPAPHEGPAKAAESEATPGSLSRFKALTERLFAVDPTRFREALATDEEVRRAKRGRLRSTKAGGGGGGDVGAAQANSSNEP